MKLQFCPYCAAPLAQKDQTTYECANGHGYWNNAKSATTIVLYNDGLALFAERAREPQKGKYDFPGGFVNFGEDAAKAAYRELQEETGIREATLELIGSVSNTYDEVTSTCDLIYLCTGWQGEPVASDDVASFVWRPLNFMNTPDFAWQYPGVYELLVGKLEN